MYQKLYPSEFMVLELNFGYKLLKLNMNLQLSFEQPNHSGK